MPTPLTPPTLERVLRGLHESEIRCRIQNEAPAGDITAWIDYSSRTEKATFYGTIAGDRQVWPAADRIAAWMHETALRLFPDSPYAKEHSTDEEADEARQKLARSKRRRFASCANSMRRLAPSPTQLRGISSRRVVAVVTR